MSFAITAGVLGVASIGASIYGANKNADAIEDGSAASIAFQNRALDTQLALSRPQLEVANGALAQLAGIFGIAPPSPVNYDQLGSGTQQGGVGAFESATEGLTVIPGAKWYNRPVFTDGKGGIYSGTGRDWNISKGLSYLGQATDRKDGGLVFAGGGGGSPAFIKTADGRKLDYRDGKFYNGSTAQEIPVDAVGGQSGGQLGKTYEPTPAGGVREVLSGGSGNTGTVSAGTTGGLSLEDLVTNNPLIQFQRQEGEQSITRNLASRGLNQSGGAVKDLTKFNSDLAGAGVQQFVLDPLFQLAGFGPQANAQASSAISSNANNLSNLTMGAANARGSAYQNAGNEVGNFAGGLSSLALMNRMGAFS